MPPFTATTLLLAGGSLLAVAQDTCPALMAVRPATRETSAAGPQYDIGYIDLKKGFISTGQLLLPAPGSATAGHRREGSLFLAQELAAGRGE